MNTIVAIGGGDIESKGTLPVDREIVESCGKEEIKALFIPTASEDSEEYIQKFEETYGRELGCETDKLLLVDEELEKSEIRAKIESANVIYVGGGNTRKMMNIWREKDVDEILREGWKDGTVMSGLSAGAICWFEHGHSDSESYETDDEWDFIKVDGLGLVEDIIFCPHYHKEDREESFQEMMEQNPEKTGLAVDNEAAVKIQNGELKVIKSDETGRAYMIKPNGVREELEEDRKYSVGELRKGILTE